MSATQQRDFLSTQEAHEKTGLSVRYLQQLLQKKRLEGFKAGSVWFVYENSLSNFITQPRKRGPKGPHKKKSANSDQTALPEATPIRSKDHESRQEAKKL
jgi:hypothetical protein